MRTATAVMAGLAGATVATGATAQAPALEPPGETIVCRWVEIKGSLEMEQPCLPRFNGTAVRSGDILRVALRNGTTKAFTDAPLSCEDSKERYACTSFKLKGYYPQNDSVVVARY